MYKVILLNINSNISYTVHNCNVSKTNLKVTSGSIVKGINSIGSFSFTILKNNPAFDYVYPYTSLIQVYNQKKNRYDFKGRILKIKPNMSSDGLVSKTIICEDRLGYLQDSIQPYLEEKYWQGDNNRNGLEEFIDYILDNHNSQVDDYKKIYRGRIKVKTFTSSNNVSKGLNYESTWEIISKKLIDSFGGEIQLREFDNKLYLDYLEEIGEEKSTSISFKKNMQSIDREIDPTSFITRLIPLGAKIKKQIVDSTGNITEQETEERLTIAEANNGSIFIDANEINSLGTIVKTVIYNDVTNANNLLSKGKKYLEENNKLLEKTTVRALDLSLINKDIDDFEVGNYYPIYNKLVSLNEKLRVIKKTINILEPLSSTFDIGDSKKLLSSLTIEQNKSNNNALEEIKKEYVPNLRLTEEITKLMSLIQQTSSKILLEVSENYTQNSNFIATAKKLADLVLQVDYIKQSVSSWNDLTSVIEGEEKLELLNAIAGPIVYLSIYGNMVMPYPSENLYPSEKLYPLDEERLVIEDENGNKTYYELPFTQLNYLNSEVYDEFIIEDNIAYLIQRIDIDENGEFVQIDEKSTKLGEVILNLNAGTNYIYFPSFIDTKFKIRYVVKNAFSDVYARSAELETSITQLSDSINLVSSKKVDSDKIISSLNLSPEEFKIEAKRIKFEGLVTANENFRINLDGSVSTKNLYLPNGGKVIGGDGLLTNLQFDSNFGGGVGFVYYYTDGFHKNYLEISTFIPDNFKIIEAKLTLFVSPNHVHWQANNVDIYSSAKKIKLYKKDSYHEINDIYINSEIYYQDITGTEIKNAFGVDGYTPPEPTLENHDTQIVTSIDLTSYFDSGINEFLVYSDVEYTSDTINGESPVANKLGADDFLADKYSSSVKGVINVIGYKFIPQNESEAETNND